MRTYFFKFSLNNPSGTNTDGGTGNSDQENGNQVGGIPGNDKFIEKCYYKYLCIVNWLKYMQNTSLIR